MKTRGKKKALPEDIAKTFIAKGEDPKFITETCIDHVKGRGVTANTIIKTGSFVAEYKGDLIDGKDGSCREENSESVFRFFFTWKGAKYCIDATKEPAEDARCRLGRLINHGSKSERNCKVRILEVRGRPHICFFSTKEISSGAELLYDYGFLKNEVPWEQPIKKKTADVQSENIKVQEDGNSDVLSKQDEASSPDAQSGEQAQECQQQEIPNEKGGEDPQLCNQCQPGATPADSSTPRSILSAPQHISRIPGMFEVPSPSYSSSCSLAMSSPRLLPKMSYLGSQRAPRNQMPDLSLGSSVDSPKIQATTLGTEQNRSIQLHTAYDFVPESDCDEDHDDIIKQRNPDRGTSCLKPKELKHDENKKEACADLGIDLGKKSPVLDMGEKGLDITVDEIPDDVPPTDEANISNAPSSENELVEDDVESMDDSVADPDYVTHFSDEEPTHFAQESCSTPPSTSTPQDMPVSYTTTSKIQVNTTGDGSHPSWKKPQYCKFCMRPQKKLPRHLASVHKNEAEVQQWLGTDDKRVKHMHLTLMRNYGNYLHNCDVLKEGHGELIVIYRPGKEADPREYLPCPQCYGFITKNDLWKHKCSQNPEQKSDMVGLPTEKGKRKSHVSVARKMLPSSSILKNEKTKSILSKMREDSVSGIVKSDHLIVAFAENLTDKHGHSKDQENYIRQRTREIARMVEEYRKVTKQPDADLTSIICPTKFSDIVKATQKAAGYDETTQLYKTPSLALKIGHSMKACCEILHGESLMNGDRVTERRCKDFLDVYKLKWEGKVSHHALRSLQETKRNSLKLLPLTEDITEFSKYLKEKVHDLHVKLEKENNPQRLADTWKELAEVLLAQVVVFNRKRPGEISKMTLADYQKCSKGEGHIIDGALSDWERALCQSLWRVEVVGKRCRTVAVIFTNAMKSAIDLMNKKRKDAGISDGNVYLFAAKSGEGHLRACDSIREHSSMADTEQPELLRATRLRKQIATVSQIMNLQGNELDILASFLGHDIRTHREYYRLPESTLQVAKVSKVLLMMERGEIQGLAGKGLDEIQVQQDEDYNTDANSDSESDDGSKSADEGDTNVHVKKKERQPCTQLVKKQWTAEEKAAILKHFESYLRSRKLPGKGAIDEAMKREPIALKKRTWKNIKDFIRNQIRKRDAFSFSV